MNFGTKQAMKVLVALVCCVAVVGGTHALTKKNNEHSKNKTDSLVNVLENHTYAKSSVLITGSEFNRLIPDSTTSVEFRNTATPVSNNVINVSGDGETYAWMEGTTMVVYSQNKITLNEDSTGMFKNKKNLQTIDLTCVDSSEVKSFQDFFYNDKGLTQVYGFQHLDTSKSKSFKNMCSNCTSLKMIDVSNMVTSNATTLENVFRNCYVLEEIDVTNWDTSNVTNFASVFGGCRSVKTLNLKSWITKKATTMADLFCGCWALEELDLSNFETENVEDFSWTFCDMHSIKIIDISSFKTPKLKRMYKMFYNDLNLKRIYASYGWDNANALNEDSADAGDAYRTFTNCHRLEGAIPFTSSKQGPTMANYRTGYFVNKAHR